MFSAGSLDTLMTKTVGPAFHTATGYTLVDTSHGSGTLAADIKNKVAVADVFVSASPAVDTTLMGASNGDWVSWYAAFASSPEVLGYYPKSKFAKDLQTMPWYKVITMPGFRLGRTNPSQDPGGVLAAKALERDGDGAASSGAEDARDRDVRRSTRRTLKRPTSRPGSSTRRSCTRPTPTPRTAPS